MDRPLQKAGGILGREVRPEHGDARQVKPAVGEHLQDGGMLAHGAGHGDPQAGLRLREVKHVGAVRKHGGAGFPGVEPTVVHLGDVVDEIRLDAAGVAEQ
jgi:hypothetical protein